MIEELGLAGGQWELFAVNDNAANAKLGVKLSGYLNQYLCVIHTLELATKDTSKNTPGMKELSKKTKKLGRFTHKSTVATKELKRECRKENIAFRQVANPPNTRWSGMHKNFASVLHLKKALVNLTSCRVNWHVHSLTPAEWKLLEGAVKILKIVTDTIETLEAEKVPTMHRVVERIYTMHGTIDSFTSNPMNNKSGIGFARELKRQTT